MNSHRQKKSENTKGIVNFQYWNDKLIFDQGENNYQRTYSTL